MNDAARPGNRLLGEKSPYLLQHAHNPVDWYPWGEEALARARSEDTPIFLSIGYSTCHWCHVMERESFEDEAIAATMNAHYVCIKVDREERPDLDEIYMAAVQAMVGQGGWPLNVWLTPDLVPFYGGTYFPPDDRFGRPGFPKVLAALADAWENRRDDVLRQSEQLRASLARLASIPADPEMPRQEWVEGAIEELAGIFDSKAGGWGNAPKFPRADFGSLALRVHHRTGSPRALEMARTTLDAMARGGIYDHLGGGFARYSTDDRWLVPHFEKMLYDNAQLVFHYTEAFQLTRDAEYERVVRETCDYVLRDMTHARGGFFSAEDADSEGVEGRFYVWTLKEIAEVLDVDQREVFVPAYGVRAEGNWEGHCVLERVSTDEAIAARLGLAVDEVRARLRVAREALFAHRELRVRPGLDDKVLTAWNGMMIRGLARAAVVFAEPRYAEAATRAADFVLTDLVAEGTLLRRWREGEAGIEAYAEDYALFVQGLLELFQTTQEVRWLRAAIDLHDQLFARFADADGSLFHTRADEPDLLVRAKVGYDGSTPTANSVAAQNTIVLFELTGVETYAAQCERLLLAFGGVLARSPLSMATMLLAVDAWFAERVEVVIAHPAGESVSEWVRHARRDYHPDLVVLALEDGGAGDGLRRLAPALEGKASEGRATAYVCRGFACRRPQTDVEAWVLELAASSSAPSRSRDRDKE